MTVPRELLLRPKIELHLHLDCSLQKTALRRLGQDISDAEFQARFTAPEKCQTLMQYLSAIGPSCDILQTAEALRIATEELIAALALDGVIHAEIRFAPHTHLAGGLGLDDVLEAVTTGATQAAALHKMSVGLILCALRDYPADANLPVIELAHRWRDRGVVGVDIAGDEAGHPAWANVSVFDRAHDLGLPVTAHAGEAAGPESIAEVLDLLRPNRIGHGVRAIESPRMMDILKERDIHLEVCPSSNLQVGVYPDLAEHPIDRLSRHGISLSINTDARTVAPLSLTLEYERLAKAFHWQTADFLDHNLQAVRHAFLPEADKTVLRHRLMTGWAA